MDNAEVQMPLVSEIDAGAHREAAHGVEPVFVRRWSPRAMSGKEISDEQLRRLLEAARWAPSSYNEQPWRFIYARRDTEHWQTLFDLMIEFNQQWASKAAVLFVVVSKRMFAHNGKPNGCHSFDSGAAWQNLALQGSMMGLVVHGMAGFDAEKARRSLHIPDDYAVEAMIAVGRPGRTEDLPESMREREVPSDRKPLAEIACEGSFSF
jgi:nitroreductase